MANRRFHFFHENNHNMRVCNGLDQLPIFKNAVVTIGTFDGVHIGHQKILARLNQIAKTINGESILITFHPHPRIVLQQDKDLKLLNTLDEKIALLEKYQLDNLIIAPFTHSFSQLSAEEYVKDFLLKNTNAHTIVVGYDHRFGKNRVGDIQLLRKLQKELNFELEEISKEMIEDITISSTKIRNQLALGNMEKSNQLLGHKYQLSGRVVKGNQIGRTIGFPTANIEIENPYKLIPANGAYASQLVFQDRCYNGMLNIGFRPTVDGVEKRIEVNLFDFNQDIYDEEISIYPLYKLREEQKFESIDALKEQLIKDKAKATTYLQRFLSL